jgi:hypothetical protein
VTAPAGMGAVPGQPAATAATGTAMRPHGRVVMHLASMAIALSVLTATVGLTGTAARATTVRPVAEPYTCAQDGPTSYGGTFGDAAVIGWAGDTDGVIACLGGSFYVRDGKNVNLGYGLYNDTATTWGNADGYLPALVTGFSSHGATVSITNFGDRDVIGGHAYVVIYSRVQIHNPTTHAIDLAPAATPGLTALDHTSAVVPPGATVDHDFAVAADRFGGKYKWPTTAALVQAGDWAGHFSHMKTFWDKMLGSIAHIQVPDASLVDAYNAGFIYTQIIRDGNRLTTGENGYDGEFSHDVIGILANLFTQGDFASAHALLNRADFVIGTQTQYADGLWTYSWPWAVYLEKTGDLSFVRAHFATAGPLGAGKEPSIKATAHAIAKDRTGPGGIMEETNDIDANGYWTIDNYEALMGLVAYRYLALKVGDKSEATWAAKQYASLLAATNKTLDATIRSNDLSYLPCSMVEPNTDNRCVNAEDANWAAPFLFGRWAWDGYLFGVTPSGPGVTMIDATYDYGFGRLAGELPADTFGGYSPDFWSTAYNAGYGSWALAGATHRDVGILAYEFMIANDQSGPYSWWESSSTPNPGSPWIGVHPSSGNGSAPHAWGIANANKVLLDSLIAERSDGSVIVGRGVPDAWVRSGATFATTNFPTTDGHRMDFSVTTKGRAVVLTLGGHVKAGAVRWELPAFVNNIASTSAGTVDEATGTVAVTGSDHSVTVVLRTAV